MKMNIEKIKIEYEDLFSDIKKEELLILIKSLEEKNRQIKILKIMKESFLKEYFIKDRKYENCLKNLNLE